MPAPQTSAALILTSTLFAIPTGARMIVSTTGIFCWTTMFVRVLRGGRLSIPR